MEILKKMILIIFQTNKMEITYLKNKECIGCGALMPDHKMKYCSDVCSHRTLDAISRERFIQKYKEDLKANHSWVCNCYDGLGFIKEHNEYCCFLCLKINPNL